MSGTILYPFLATRRRKGDFVFVVDLWTVLLAIIIIIAVLPVILQRVVQVRRFRVLRSLEEERGTRVIALIHRQQRISLLGIPFFRYIDITDAEEILRAIRLTPADMPIDIILHTPGGLVFPATHIAIALKNHRGRITAFVPHYAMSGGTLICLAADEIVMDKNALLGPVDPQLERYPAASVLKVPLLKEPKDIDDKTLILADIAQKAQDQLRVFVKGMVSGAMGEENAARLAAVLTEGKWTHDYPITFEEAQALGIPVSSGLPGRVYELVDLFLQGRQRSPSVEYIPAPYRRKEG